MSELTPCNRCSLDRIRQDAAKQGKQVTIKTGADGWKAVYVHSTGASPLKAHWVGSMMKIGDDCGC